MTRATIALLLWDRRCKGVLADMLPCLGAPKASLKSWWQSSVWQANPQPRASRAGGLRVCDSLHVGKTAACLSIALPRLFPTLQLCHVGAALKRESDRIFMVWEVLFRCTVVRPVFWLAFARQGQVVFFLFVPTTQNPLLSNSRAE